MKRPVVFMTGAGGGMGYESFKMMLPDLGKLFDLVILVRDSDKNRKLFEKYIGKPGFLLKFGDLLNKEDVADCVRRSDLCLHIAAFVSPQADYYPKKAMEFGNATCATKNTVFGDLLISDFNEISAMIASHQDKGHQSEMNR